MQHKTFNLSKVSLLTLSALSLLATAAQAAPQKSGITLEVNETKAIEPPTRFIVKYKNAATLSAQGLASTATSSVNQLKTHAASELSSRAGEPMSFVRSLAVANRHVVKAERRLSKAETARTIELLAQDPMVESVEEDRMLQIAATPNDTQYTSQWHYYESTGGLRANTAWDNATGTGVVVAVLDTGYRPHADLNANILPGYDMITDTFIGNDGNGRDNNPQDPGDWVAVGELALDGRIVASPGVLLAALHAQLWLGRGSVPRVNEMQRQIDVQKAANDQAKLANERLSSEVHDLKEGLDMVEEKARSELGMVKPNEVYVQFTPR